MLSLIKFRSVPSVAELHLKFRLTVSFYLNEVEGKTK